MNKRINKLNKNEFIALMAMLMSVTALSIDAMIPALGKISVDLMISEANSIQLVISSVFLGIAFGVLIYGPFADSYGRKKAIYLGIFIFLIGTLISIFATNLFVMLLGRTIQGFGSAACRVVTMAIIRDKYEGKEMAKIMSLIMMVFIMVPALAPLLGQGILIFASWQTIFWFIFVFALISATWMHFRQRETISLEKVRSFSLTVIFSGILETIKNRISMGYTLASGIMFGAFVSYLSSAQQIMEIQYELGRMFPLIFGFLAIVYGFASFLNSKLLNKFSMHQICLASLVLQVSLSSIFLIISLANNKDITFNLFFTYMILNFFCIGPLFGNFNSMALQPFGHMAGLATSVISSIQTLSAVVVGIIIGQAYDGTVKPIILGYMLCGMGTLLIFLLTKRRISTHSS
jgi:DHA1 family bicyclomycin/chloramphenicol resistance-like MFS transporter